MSDPGAPENPSPEESSTPAGARPEDAQTKPAGATGDDIPDAAPAEVPAAGGAVEEVVPAEAGASSSEQAVPEDVPTPREPDPLRDPILEAMQAVLGEAILGAEILHGELTVRVEPRQWRRTIDWCKAQGFTYFCFLSGIDWMPNEELSNRYEQTFGGADDEATEAEATEDEDSADEAAPATAGGGGYETGVAGGDTRFQVFARLFDVDRKVGIICKADLDDDQPSIESIVPVFRGADWHERETWEMYGFDFVGHPGLRHLYLPTEFEGFPLRKDFPVLARAVKPWPGLVDKEPVPGEDDEAEASA